MDSIYNNIDDYNPTRKRKILFAFDDMVADIMTNKKFQAMIKELFNKCRKLNIYLVFITQIYFSVPKTFRFITKMTLTDELKILDDKIKANQAQYDLEREAAKISALSSKELDKYEYLTGEDLGYEPGIVERAKFEYSPLGKTLSKGLKKYDKVNKVIKYNNDLVYNSMHNLI